MWQGKRYHKEILNYSRCFVEYKVDSDDQSIREFAVLTDINLFDCGTFQADQTKKID